MENTASNQKSAFIFIAAFLAILVPVPGRFVYGFTILLELTILVLVGTLMDSLIKKLQMDSLRTVIDLFVLLSFTVLYRQLIAIFWSEVALTLGFVFYLPTISLFLIGLIFRDGDMKLKEKLKYTMTDAMFFDISGILFFLFRDIASYGTFTFFGKNHQIFEKLLLPADKVGIFSFFASIPGGLMLGGIFIFLRILFMQKFKIITNAQNQNEVKQ